MRRNSPTNNVCSMYISRPSSSSSSRDPRRPRHRPKSFHAQDFASPPLPQLCINPLSYPLHHPPSPTLCITLSFLPPASYPLSYPLPLFKKKVLSPPRPPLPLLRRLWAHPHACVCTHIRVCVRPGRASASTSQSHAINIIMCVGASVRVCAHVYVRMCTCVRACVRACVCVCVYV